MAHDTKQVFSTHSPRRWYTVKGVLYCCGIVLVVGLLTLLFTYSDSFKPELPKNFTELDNESLHTIAKDKSISWHKNALGSCCASGDKPRCISPLSNKANVPLAQQVRAGFFVNWDPQSFFTLESNIDKINMVLPEWLFVSDADTVSFQPDERAYKLLQEHPSVAVVPMLSNIWKRKWNKDNIGRIIKNKKKRQFFIENLVGTLNRYGFKGVNIDFEGLPDEYTEDFYTFLTALRDRLKKDDLMLSQSIVPFNSQYKPERLTKINDLLFVMAYNQHYMTGESGPIADQKWVESIMHTVSKDLPADKFVLCMASYGLDWGKTGVDAKDLSYRGALSIAKESNAKVIFNDTTYNLEFKYVSNDSVPHKVFFVDAATNFNQMRAATNFGWRGVALWRLGSEDPRLWQFYDKDLSTVGLQNGSFDVSILNNSQMANDVEYIGAGEVVDIMTEPEEGVIHTKFDTQYQLVAEESYEKLPSSYVVQRYGKVAEKKLVLTFDDGPDKNYTTKVLDILKTEQAPAAFFLIGSNIEKNQKLVKRIYDEGHEIGNHTYSHPKLDNLLRVSADLELNKTRRSIESIIDHTTILFRPPYNQFQEPETRAQLTPFILARDHNYLTVNESIDAQDWKAGSTVDSIITRIETGINRGNGHIILLHDAGGIRDSTIAALPHVIRYFRKKGYVFTSISDLVGISKAHLMPHVSETQRPIVRINRFLTDIVHDIQSSLYWIFYAAIGLSIFRSLFILFFAFLQRRKQKTETYLDFTPPLSIIVPAYNEEMNAVSTVLSLLKQNYPHYEIVFVDDGSKDETYQRVKDVFGNNPRVQIWKKQNGGKASALNFGLLKSRYEYVVCIDADTQLDPNALLEIAKPFQDPSVGAVAGNVQVGNQINWLTKWQSIEYTTAQNFDRMAFAYLNCITVVPGAIGAFRRDAVTSIRTVEIEEERLASLGKPKVKKQLVGDYETDTLAEDCDLTIRIIKKGYKVVQNNNAFAITESPETLKQFLKQRFRWTFGVLQAFWKNKEVLFNTKYKSLGWIAFPNILIYQFLLPVFAPLADFILLVAIIDWMISDPIAVGNISFVEEYFPFIMYAVFLFFDLLCAAVALRYEKQSLRNLWMIIPQRFAYRPLMYFVLYKSFVKALKGELQGWGVLKRTGSMGQLSVDILEGDESKDVKNTTNETIEVLKPYSGPSNSVQTPPSVSKSKKDRDLQPVRLEKIS